MKVNLPVTQREKPFPKGAYLVSKTDLKGVITYVNDAFVEISGFSREELIGKSHNIVRHPDMPPAAFADLWRTVKSGNPWRGIVKNRCKDGDHYWVEAEVVPLREGERIVGYMSVRSEPSREAIREAEALYARLRGGSGSLDVRAPWWRRISIRARLLGTMALLAALLAGGAVIGTGGLYLSHEALEHANEARLKPIDEIGRITVLMTENARQLAIAQQHEPNSPFARAHDHPLSRHTDAVVKNNEEIRAITQRFLARIASDSRFAQTAEELRKAEEGLIEQAFVPAHAALVAGEFLPANRILLEQVHPALARAAEAARKLQDELTQASEADYRRMQSQYDWIRVLAIGGTLTALVIVALMAWNLLSAIARPLNRVIEHFAHIGQGILTDRIDISGRDEAGRVLTQLAAMQVQLKVMLDEIQAAAKTIEQQVMQVEWQTASVADQSEQQHDRAASVAAATEEFSQTVNHVADDARAAAAAADEAQERVAVAQQTMEQSSDATGRVVEAVQAASKTITGLNQAVARIGDISQVIKEIADQTNLLALNAAIEAARAGEMGRGFAVVADEVRKLAERTATSTSDIFATVDEVRHAADGAVTSMNHAVTEVEQGIGMVRQSVAGLSRITEASRDVASRSRQISDAAAEQATAANDVAENMERISALAQNNLESVQQARAAASALREAAGELRRVAAQFKTGV